MPPPKRQPTAAVVPTGKSSKDAQQRLAVAKLSQEEEATRLAVDRALKDFEANASYKANLKQLEGLQALNKKELDKKQRKQLEELQHAIKQYEREEGAKQQRAAEDASQFLEQLVQQNFANMTYDDFTKTYNMKKVRMYANFAGKFSHYLFDAPYASQMLAREKARAENKRGAQALKPLPEKKFTDHQLAYVSPKMLALIQQIQQQDAADMATHGKLFKHFIFSDVRSSAFGVRMIASCLAKALGLHFVYKCDAKLNMDWNEPADENEMDDGEEEDDEAGEQEEKEGGARGGAMGGAKESKYWGPVSLRSIEDLKKTPHKNIAVMTTLAMFGQDDPAEGKRIRKEVNKLFNLRRKGTNNSHGELIRFICLDGGFKEGVDLYDVKYVHLFETPDNTSFRRQIVGRALRLCGQSGLDFETGRGWTVYVNEYDTVFPPSLYFKFNHTTSTNQLYLSVNGRDKELDRMMDEMETLSMEAAVDYELNYLVHERGLTQRGTEVDAPPKMVRPGKKEEKKEKKPEPNEKKDAKRRAPAKKQKPAEEKTGGAGRSKEARLQEDFLEDDEGGLTRDQLLAIRQAPFPYEDGTTFQDVQRMVRETFSMPRYKWPKPEAVNGCLAAPVALAAAAPIAVERMPAIAPPKSSASRRKSSENSSDSDKSKDGRYSEIADSAEEEVEEDLPVRGDEQLSEEDEELEEERMYEKLLDMKGGSLRGFLVGSGAADRERRVHNQYSEQKRMDLETKVTTVKYNPSQVFIRDYFTPYNPRKGILLWHSMGAGKTCAAIATVSSSFVQQNYRVLWVTRSSLKEDMLKNIVESTCLFQLRHKDKLVIDARNQVTKIRVDSGWFQNMTYRQFSNLLAGESKGLQESLRRVTDEQYELDNVPANDPRRNDPLYKKIIVIDEAHKLVSTDDLMATEIADYNVVQNAFQQSYRLSGKDSCRVMLMTATPLVKDPMDLVRLLNLLMPVAEQYPPTLPQFAQEYCDGTHTLTPEGKIRFQNKLAGYVSYLNRKYDVTQFAQAVTTQVAVPIFPVDVQQKSEYFNNLAFRNDLELVKEVDYEVNKLLKYDLTLLKREYQRLQEDFQTNDVLGLRNQRRAAAAAKNAQLGKVLNRTRRRAQFVVRNAKKKLLTEMKGIYKTRKVLHGKMARFQEILLLNATSSKKEGDEDMAATTAMLYSQPAANRNDGTTSSTFALLKGSERRGEEDSETKRNRRQRGQEDSVTREKNWYYRVEPATGLPERNQFDEAILFPMSQLHAGDLVIVMEGKKKYVRDGYGNLYFEDDDLQPFVNQGFGMQRTRGFFYRDPEDTTALLLDVRMNPIPMPRYVKRVVETKGKDGNPVKIATLREKVENPAYAQMLELLDDQLVPYIEVIFSEEKGMPPQLLPHTKPKAAPRRRNKPKKEDKDGRSPASAEEQAGGEEGSGDEEEGSDDEDPTVPAGAAEMPKKLDDAKQIAVAHPAMFVLHHVDNDPAQPVRMVRQRDIPAHVRMPYVKRLFKKRNGKVIIDERKNPEFVHDTAANRDLKVMRDLDRDPILTETGDAILFPNILYFALYAVYLSNEKARLADAAAAEKQRHAAEAARVVAAEKQQKAEEAAKKREAAQAEKQQRAEEAAKKKDAAMAEKQQKEEEAARRKQALLVEKQHKEEEAARKKEAAQAEKQRKEEEAARKKEAALAEQLRKEEEAARKKEAAEKKQREIEQLVAEEMKLQEKIAEVETLLAQVRSEIQQAKALAKAETDKAKKQEHRAAVTQYEDFAKECAASLEALRNDLKAAKEATRNKRQEGKTKRVRPKKRSHDGTRKDRSSSSQSSSSPSPSINMNAVEAVEEQPPKKVKKGSASSDFEVLGQGRRTLPAGGKKKTRCIGRGCCGRTALRRSRKTKLQQAGAKGDSFSLSQSIATPKKLSLEFAQHLHPDQPMPADKNYENSTFYSLLSKCQEHASNNIDAYAPIAQRKQDIAAINAYIKHQLNGEINAASGEAKMLLTNSKRNCKKIVTQKEREIKVLQDNIARVANRHFRTRKVVDAELVKSMETVQTRNEKLRRFVGLLRKEVDNFTEQAKQELQTAFSK